MSVCLPPPHTHSPRPCPALPVLFRLPQMLNNNNRRRNEDEEVEEDGGGVEGVGGVGTKLYNNNDN